MDIQIDLTENRDFQDSKFGNRGISLSNIRKIWENRYGCRHAWSFDRFEESYKDTGFIHTGTQEERRFKQLPEFGTKGSCDCCGNNTSDYGWQMNSDNNLCSSCIKRMNYKNENERLGWKK